LWLLVVVVLVVVVLFGEGDSRELELDAVD
jgi:Sec-independent protein translocase protein TatA